MIYRRFTVFLSGLELTHQGTSVKGNSLIVKGVVALGSVPSHAGKVSLTLALMNSSGGSLMMYQHRNNCCLHCAMEHRDRECLICFSAEGQVVVARIVCL